MSLQVVVFHVLFFSTGIKNVNQKIWTTLLQRIYWGALRRYDWRLRDHVITTNRYNEFHSPKKKYPCPKLLNNIGKKLLIWHAHTAYETHSYDNQGHWPCDLDDGLSNLIAWCPGQVLLWLVGLGVFLSITWLRLNQNQGEFKIYLSAPVALIFVSPAKHSGS